ncbi:serine/threonine-protein kinase [Leisingera sp. SS27]|uniref:serine/threonine-protein kinase n=1 Tax=Leisingera sp. SS27 TaxID=2979462 RepID=UPI00232EC3E8|nr:serine/threonine-protein kinase [Leisingera sp. SS27]MDC0660779.1 serine/threonine-protein kinase [Leisingera sp. SS27]
MALNSLVETSVDADQQDDLQPGTTLLHGQYTITRFLNNGGFGITYLAKDSLDRTVVIKECFADAFCRRTNALVSARSRAHQSELKSIIRHFIREAQSLSKLKHPNIVGVHQVFEDNDTAYMAIDYVDGRDLQDILDDQNTVLTPEQITGMTRKLLNAIGYVHDANLLHRDISPDNILLTADDEPVLIDFGAAREDTSEDGRKHSALRVVKDGYSPQEFYIAGSEQGPWSDLYALAASLYHVIRGEAPVNGQARLVAIAEQRPDPYQPLAGAVDGYPEGFLEAIDKAMNTKPSMRLQSAEDWLAMLDGKKPAAAAPQAANSTAAPVHEEKKRSRLPAVSVLAVVAGLGAAGYVYYGNTQADAAAEQPTAAVETAAIAEPAPVAADPAPAAAAPAPVAAAAETEAAAPAEPAEPAEPAVQAAEPAPAEVSEETTAVAAVAEPAQPEPAAAPAPFAGHEVSYALWDVSIPFEFEELTVRKAQVVSITGTGETTDLSKTGSWIAPGVEILTVNNQPLSAGSPFASQLLTAMQIDPDGYTRASVRYKDAESKRFEMGLLAVPVVRRTGLNSGLQFEARMQDGAWVTSVSQQAAQGSADLQPGDVLLRETATGTALTGAESLAEILQGLQDKGAATATFDILRDGAAASASLELAGNS